LRQRVLVRVVLHGGDHERATREAEIDAETRKGKGMEMGSVLGLVIIAALVIVVVTVIVAVVVAATRRSGSASSNNPNLTPCPDCGRLVSIRATTCPHCGGPVQFK
jgi:hypothetical protein